MLQRLIPHCCKSEKDPALWAHFFITICRHYPIRNVAHPQWVLSDIQHLVDFLLKDLCIGLFCGTETTCTGFKTITNYRPDKMIRIFYARIKYLDSTANGLCYNTNIHQQKRQHTKHQNKNLECIHNNPNVYNSLLYD